MKVRYLLIPLVTYALGALSIIAWATWKMVQLAKPEQADIDIDAEIEDIDEGIHAILWGDEELCEDCPLRYKKEND